MVTAWHSNPVMMTLTECHTAPAAQSAIHPCLTKAVFLFFFFKQHKFEVRFKVTEHQQQSEIRREAPSPLNLMATTGELAGSNATSSILIARLSFSDSFADVPRARSACTNQAVNMSKLMGKRGNTSLPVQQQPFKRLYSLHIQY